MKREELKTKLIEAGLAEDKLGGVMDYIMAQNGAELNSLKAELETTKTNYNDQIKGKDALIKDFQTKVDGFKDYEELKQFKADTLAKAENTKRVEFLKANGCKHPDLMMSKIDFSKAQYDEEKNTFVGLEADMQELKKNYVDLFESGKMQQITPNVAPQNGQDPFMDAYLKEHPEMAKYMPKIK